MSLTYERTERRRQVLNVSQIDGVARSAASLALSAVGVRGAIATQWGIACCALFDGAAATLFTHPLTIN